MAVHLPLSIEAQIEARTLMLSTNNIFSPASGEPVITPSQDIVLGIYYLTTMIGEKESEEKLKRFSNYDEVLMAYALNKVRVHTQIRLRLNSGKIVKNGAGEQIEQGLCVTTVGRVVFNETLPHELPFYNYPLDHQSIKGVIQDCYKILGKEATIDLLDKVKEISFKECTKAGLSLSIIDLKMPKKKAQILEKTHEEVEKKQKLYHSGIITEGERYNQLLDYIFNLL